MSRGRAQMDETTSMFISSWAAPDLPIAFDLIVNGSARRVAPTRATFAGIFSAGLVLGPRAAILLAASIRYTSIRTARLSQRLVTPYQRESQSRLRHLAPLRFCQFAKTVQRGGGNGRPRRFVNALPRDV